MKRKTNRSHISQVAGLLSLGLLLQIGCTYPLWMYEEWRTLPTIPIFEHWSLGIFAVDFLNLLAIIISLLVIMFSPQRRGWYVFFALLMLLFWLQDANRFQYPIYLFSLWLFSIYFYQKTRESQLVQAIQMGLIGTYFWRGFYQIHPYYIDWLTTQRWWDWLQLTPTAGQCAAYFPGALSVVIALGLFFSATRLYVLGLAVLYHSIELAMHWSPVVAHHPAQWVFHTVMICLLFVLFRYHLRPIFSDSYRHLKTFPIVPYAFIIFGAVPFFQFLFPLHPTLALQPATTRITATAFFFHRQDRFCLPAEVEPYVFSKTTDTTNKKILYVQLHDWFVTELGVPYTLYAQREEALLKSLCQCLDYEHQGGFSVVKRDWWQLQEEIIEIRCK
ncbi:MAG: hypothetical protein AAGK47_08610 [Bacteroidota bacterium]